MNKKKNFFLQFDSCIFLILLITSCGGGGGSASSPSDATKPSNPASLSATPFSTSQIDLSWNASTDNVAVAGYKIYKGGVYLKTVSATSTSDTGLTGNTTYCYTVSAYDAAGNESGQSSQACATTLIPPPSSDTTVPSVPAGLSAAGVSTTQIDLSWNASTDNIAVAGYKIYKSGIYLKAVSAASTSDTGLTENTTYCYTVLAYDTSGNESGQSSQACATTLIPPPSSDTTAPSVPAGLSAAGVSTTQIDLSWNASMDNVAVAGYKVYKGGVYLKAVSAASASDTGLTANTAYCYTVLAYDTSGNESAQTSQVCATTMTEWPGTKQWGTPYMDDSRGVVLDGDGNVYVTGFTNGNLDDNVSAGDYDAFLTKFNSSGTKQWTKLFGSTGIDYSFSIAVDSSSNIYVTGVTYGDLDGYTHSGNGDIFLAKFNSSGAKEWTRVWGTAENDTGYSVAVDHDGNVYVTGGTQGNLDGNINSGLTLYDVFLTKFDSAGNKEWTKLWGTADDDFGYGVAVDSIGNIFVTGRSSGDLDGYTQAGYGDIFLTKYDSSGTKQWTRLWGSSSTDTGFRVATDSSGNIYVIGGTQGSLDGNTNSGGDDLFMTKYDSSGSKQWTKVWGTSSYDFAYGISIDGNGNIYLAGSTSGDLDGNTGLGSHDIFLMKIDDSGTKKWTQLLGTAAYDHAVAVAANAGGYIFVSGYTTGDLDGNTNAGQDDIFLLKFNSEGVKQ